VCNTTYYACNYCDKISCLECGFIYMINSAGNCPERTISECLIEVGGKCYECTYTGDYVNSDRTACLDNPGLLTLYCQKQNMTSECVLCEHGYLISGTECVLKADECKYYTDSGDCERCVFTGLKDGDCYSKRLT
jgi:hypothetical protein